MPVLEKSRLIESPTQKTSKERQGPTLGVRFIEVSVKRESPVLKLFLKKSILNTGVPSSPDERRWNAI